MPALGVGANQLLDGNAELQHCPTADPALPIVRAVSLLKSVPHLLRGIVPGIGEAAGKVPGNLWRTVPIH